MEIAAPYDKALALSYSISEGECFRTHHPDDPNDEYVSDYIKFMVKAAIDSNFEVKRKDSRRRRRPPRSPQKDTKHITSLPSGVQDSFNDSLLKIRTFCENYLHKWAKIDDDNVGQLWFNSMHEPRVHEFSESLANFLMNQKLTTIRLIFSQAGFLSNLIQLMLVFSSLKANSSNATSKSLIVCAFESDPTVISMCFIFVLTVFLLKRRVTNDLFNRPFCQT